MVTLTVTLYRPLNRQTDVGKTSDILSRMDRRESAGLKEELIISGEPYYEAKTVTVQEVEHEMVKELALNVARSYGVDVYRVFTTNIGA